MEYTPESPLRSQAVGTSDGWSTALRARGADDPPAIADAYFTLAPQVGLNADLALAQACLEANWFRSDRWLRQRNPAGVGITSSDAPGEDFGSIQRGVQVHLAHLCCYVYTAADCPVERLGWSEPRHFFHDGMPRLRDLIRPPRRSWAVPGDHYVASILGIVNTVLAGMPSVSAQAAGSAPSADVLLERAFQAQRERLGPKQFAGLLRRPDFGDGAADSYPMLVCERAMLIVVDGQVRDVTDRCLRAFIATSEAAGALQRF